MKHTYTFLTFLLLYGEAAMAQTTLTFTPLNNLPGGGRYGMGYCQDAAAFYMVGGGSPTTAYNADVYRYEPMVDAWGPGSAGTSLTPQRLGTMAPATNGAGQPLLYVLNGTTAAGTPVTNMQTVSVASGAVGPVYTNPVPASGAAVAVWNNIIYAFGGQSGGTYTNQLRAYNPTTDTWTTLAPMPDARAVYGGAAVNGKVFAIGGYNGVINSARVDVYDIATNTWLALGTLPTTVSNQAVAVQGEWLWLVGDFTNQSYLAAYNTRTGQLRTFTSNLPPRRNAAAAFRNNRLYVWGGNTASANSSTLADMWSADVSTVLATGVAATAPVLQAYPNPSDGGLTMLVLPADTRTIEVFDALGRQVLTAAPAAGAATWALDLRGQSAGFYMVRVRTAQGASSNCRVVR